MLLERNFLEALSYYQQASSIEPDRPAVLLGLARAHYELENYGYVNSNYLKLKDAKPELAEQFAYLDMQHSDAIRASSVEEMRGMMVWEDPLLDH